MYVEIMQGEAQMMKILAPMPQNVCFFAHSRPACDLHCTTPEGTA